MEKLYQNKEWLEKKYIEEKLSMNVIGGICKIDSKTIWYWLKKFNIPCRERYIKKPNIKKICPVCKKEFYFLVHDKNKRKYCSHKCWLTKLAIYQRKKIKNGVLDNNFYINSAGYISRFGSEGKGYHREIIENIIGEKIKKDECVHHIDLDKKNINKNNLLLMAKNKHQLLHWQLNSVASVLVKKGFIKFDLENKKYYISEGDELNGNPNFK